MADEEHLAILQQGVEAWNAQRNKGSLTYPNLAGANFGGLNLSGINLDMANLQGVLIRDTNLFGAMLFRANLYEACWQGGDLRGANLRQANFNRANLAGASLAMAAFTGASFEMACLNGANLSRSFLQGASMVGAGLAGAKLCVADLQGARMASVRAANADFYAADLTGANLRAADLTGVKLTEAHLRGANLTDVHLLGADLHGADLREASLIDARLDGADLTGAKLWETQRGGWSIKGVICRRAFWNRDGEVPTEYADGEFERLFAEKPPVKLHYPGALSPADLLALPLVLQRLQDEHPDSELRVRSMQEDAGGVTVTIFVDDLAGRSAEEIAQEHAKLQAKVKHVEGSLDYFRNQLVPQLVATIAASGQMTIINNHIDRIIGTAVLGGTMSGNIYNNLGQAGAVGPNAHVHDNTFQQVQRGIDLPRLTEELGRLRAALRQETKGELEDDEAIGAVAAAEKAAKQGDEAGVRQHLKAVAARALGIAEKIGVEVTVELLKRGMV